MIDLEAIKARCEKATPGPWETDPYKMFVFEPSTNMVAEIRGYGAKLPQEANIEFIAHAREDIPALLAEIDRLTGELESAEENANSLHVYWKGAEVRAEKAESNLSEEIQSLARERDDWKAKFEMEYDAGSMDLMGAQKWEAKCKEAERERDSLKGRFEKAVREWKEEVELADQQLQESQEEHLVTASWGRGAVDELSKLKAKLSEVEAELELYRIDEQDIPPEAELQAKLQQAERERDEANGYLDRWCHNQYTPDKTIFEDTVIYLAQFEEDESV